MRLIIITAVLVALALGTLLIAGTGGGSAPKDDATTTTAATSAPATARDRRELRADLLRAANRLENSPCDQRLKEPLRDAILAFIEEARPTRDAIDQEVATVIRAAANAGVIEPAEARGLAPTIGTVVVANGQGASITILYHNPLACDIGGATEDEPRPRPR